MSHLSDHQDQMNSFDEHERYILADYDHQRPFSSFLPGIAGLRGIPMWVFYVNRGQAVCSFGVENKDHPILEFQAANKAYQTTALMGFRTFLNGERAGERWHREAFSPWAAADTQRTMFIGMNEVEIQETNLRLGYQINVLYFTLPNLPFSGLARQVSLRNIGATPLQLEILDGLPGIIPYGVDNGALKHISRTIEAWMQVENSDNKLPYYRLKATPGDTAAVQVIHSGNFALAFRDQALLPVIVDPQVIFGQDTSHTQAHLFHEQGLEKTLATPQIKEGRGLCAFFGARVTLGPGEVDAFTSLYGYSPTLESIQTQVNTLAVPSYVGRKLHEARQLTTGLTDVIRTESAFPTFDGYCRQTFLDNLLRGGYPLLLGGRHITHVYARKHGDIERDYNYFVLPPEYYSQGNGNYRDVNQNRRNDVFFLPQAGEFNIRLFMSLIQADGYNPLVLNGLAFSLPPEKQDDILAHAGGSGRLPSLLQGRFTPGELFSALLETHTADPAEELLEKVFSQAQVHIQAEHGEGYWVDHWTYNLDLIESYLAVFPDRKKRLLFESPPLPFFDSATLVQPRTERFVLLHGNPHQLNAVIQDPEKDALIKSREEDAHWARANFGQGEIFRLPLISKLVLLALVKFNTLDPSGMGIQMEAGKPGWYDALNGLPGLFGSSMPETFELLRLVNFLMDALDEYPENIPLPIEAQVLINAIATETGEASEAFSRWAIRTDALEVYRESTRLGFDGRSSSVHIADIMQLMRAGLESGIAKAHTYTGEIPPTYFVHRVTDYELVGTHDSKGNPQIRVKRFQPVALPLFLEGPARLMKITEKPQAQRLAQAIENSALFDPDLGMYKVNAPLHDQPHEIGRARAFTPGWLENESIWLHMAFKYLLELLNAGLYDEFYAAIKKHLPAFMNAEVYGRSPLENSSFIVSSAHPDAALHGSGFVARLSGSTAEFLSMWRLMTVGKQPFRFENGELTLAFEPALPSWLFTAEGTFSCSFLGKCSVTVYNPSRTNTWDKGVQIRRIELHSDAETIPIAGDVINAPHAEHIRQGLFDAIDLFY